MGASKLDMEINLILLIEYVYEHFIKQYQKYIYKILLQRLEKNQLVTDENNNTDQLITIDLYYITKNAKKRKMAYWAVVYPLRKRLSPVKTVAIIIIIWLLACLCALPLLFYSYTQKYFMGQDGRSVKTVCQSDGFPDGNSQTSVIFRVYNYFLLFITYLSPLIVLSFTYVRMGLELWGSSHIGDHRQEAQIKAKRKIIKMMITVVAIFMLCWLPYHLYFTIFVKAFAEIPPKTALFIYLHIYLLAMSSTVVNPIIYVWMNRKYEIKKYVLHGKNLQRICSKSERNMRLLEIDVDVKKLFPDVVKRLRRSKQKND
uniref:G-protein coupled receptors family 1 profile domain-containing protein n=1 Tax=Romanomermis culicivorax TaxID=13658 RepID=A0A915JYQ2_ROMCU